MHQQLEVDIVSFLSLPIVLCTFTADIGHEKLCVCTELQNLVNSEFFLIFQVCVSISPLLLGKMFLTFSSHDN